MLKKEDLESWNSIFTNCNISEKDLANPTEQFLTKVLCAYLRKIGFKVEYLDMGTETASEKHFFLIKLVQQIDHILKITHKSYTFTYYDLLSPTKKKTSTMLSILLNYLHYTEMYKMDTLPKATELITTWQKLQESINKMQAEIKQNEIDSKKIKDEMIQLRSQVSQLKTELNKQKAAKNQREQELKELKDRLKHMDENMNTLNAQKRHLKRQVVSNVEVYELKEQIKKSENNIEEIKQAIISNEQQIKETNDMLRKIQGTVQLLNKAKDIITSKTLTELKEQAKELKIKQMEVSKSEKKKTELLEQIEQNFKDIKYNEEKLNLKRAQFDENVLEETAIIEQCKIDLLSQKQKLSRVEKEDKMLDTKIQEQDSIRELIDNSIKQLKLI